MEEIKQYLHSDCVNLWNTVNAYFDRFGRSLTQAGSSMKHWRKKYDIGMVPQTLKQSEDYREYYYGGRVQCFANGHGYQHFSVVDINSAYPEAMTHAHPISPEGEIRDHLPPGDGMEKCFIRLDAVAKGCFPLRDIDGGLFFPDDAHTVREYFVTGYELKTALELDAVKIFNIKEVHEFPLTLTFADYVEEFYTEKVAAKLRGDKVSETFAKLFLNSLYGKFASDSAKYSEYLLCHDDDLVRYTVPDLPWPRDRGPPYIRLGPWGERHLLARPLPEEKHRYYNVATAASITGYVRAYLFRAMQACSGVLYCDTDSIAARDVSRLPLGNDLGQWKLEAQCDEYAIAGKKLYAFHIAGTERAWVQKEHTSDNFKRVQENAKRWKTASKGTRLGADAIIQVSEGKKVLFTPEVPTYSIHSELPNTPADDARMFVSREVTNTFKDVSQLEYAEHG